MLFGDVFVALKAYLGQNNTSISSSSSSMLASYKSKNLIPDWIADLSCTRCSFRGQEIPCSKRCSFVMNTWAVPQYWTLCEAVWGVPELLWCISESYNLAMNQLANVSYSDRRTQYRLDWLYCPWDWQICSDQLVIWICTHACLVHLNFDQIKTKIAALPRIGEPYFKFQRKYSISPRVSQRQMGLVNVQCWSCHNVTSDVHWGFPGTP
jgi:hypothetical protein